MTNNPFCITTSGFFPDTTCPHCLIGLNFDWWQSEYRQPQDGNYKVECPACYEAFNLTVKTTTTYTAE